MSQERYTSAQIRAMVESGVIIPSQRGFDASKKPPKKVRKVNSNTSGVKKPPRIKKRKPAYVVSVQDINEQILYWKKKGGIFIPYQVISLKNSKAIYPYVDANGNPKFTVQPSKPYIEYAALSGPYYQKGQALFKVLVEERKLKTPYFIGMYFIRRSKAAWDYQNMTQGPLDLMESAGWYRHDTVRQVVPIIMGHEVAKTLPGLVIFLLEEKDCPYWLGQPTYDQPKGFKAYQDKEKKKRGKK